MIRDTTGAVTFQAIPWTEVSKREKALLEDYAQACKAYQEAKKDNPSEVKPTKPAIIVVEKTVKGKDKAETLAAQLREKYEAKQNKTDTGGKPADEKPKNAT